MYPVMAIKNRPFYTRCFKGRIVLKTRKILAAISGCCVAVSCAAVPDQVLNKGLLKQSITEETVKPFRGPLTSDQPLARGYNDAAKSLSLVDDNPLIRWEYRIWCETGYRSPEDAGTGQVVDLPVDIMRDYVSPKGFFHSKGARRLMPAGGVQFLDNAWYFGADGLGVVVVKTPGGLLVFDTMGKPEDFEMVVLSEMPAAGLDPKDISYVFLGHHHWDHIGGVNLIHEFAPEAKVVMGEPDAQIIDRARQALLTNKMPDNDIDKKAIFVWNAKPETSAALAKLYADRLRTIPDKIDILVKAEPGLKTGSLKLRTGPKTEVVAVLTPGHTPGQMSVIVPVEHQGVMRNLLVMSGNDNPDEAARYAASMDYLRSVAAQVGADTLINTHAYQSAMFYHLRQLKADPSGPNPFVMGNDGVGRFIGIFAECQRAMDNRLKDGTWQGF